MEMVQNRMQIFVVFHRKKWNNFITNSLVLCRLGISPREKEIINIYGLVNKAGQPCIIKIIYKNKAIYYNTQYYKKYATGNIFNIYRY